MGSRAGQRLPSMHRATPFRPPNSQEAGGKVGTIRESLGVKE